MALTERKFQSVDESREMGLARLDARLAAHWPAAVSGSDLKPVELCLKVSAQRTNLLGLEAPPKTTDFSEKTVAISGNSEQYIGALQALCEADATSDGGN